MIKHTLAAAALLAACGGACAVTLVGSLTQGATTVTDYSGTGLLSFDLDLANLSPVSLDYTIELDDLAAPIVFNSVTRNLTGAGLNHLTFTFDKSGFGTIGSVTRSFGGATTVNSTGHGATLAFDGPEFLDLAIGDPLASGSGTNWTIDPSRFHAGERLSITVAVPEPSTHALLLAGLGVVAGLARRRRRD